MDDNKEIQGQQKDNEDLPWTDSPTCSHEAMCLVMLTAWVMKWQVETLDFCRMVCWKERYFLNHHLIYVQSHRYGN